MKIYNSAPRRKKFHVVELRERYARQKEKNLKEAARKRKHHAHARFIRDTEFQLNKQIQKYLNEREFYRGWKAATEGMLYSQTIVDLALENCDDPTIAYIRGMRAGMDLNFLAGKTAN